MSDQEPEEVSTSTKESPFNLERSQIIQLSKEEGERELSEIARTVDREHFWVFDETTSTWHFYPLSEKHYKKIDKTKGESVFGIDIQAEYLDPPGQQSIFYHIHPDALINELFFQNENRWDDNEREFLLAAIQIPSAKDLEITVVLTKRNYKESRIVTSRGTTVIRFHPEKAKNEKIIPSLSIPRKDILEAIEEQGIIGGIEVCMQQMNTYYRGIFTFSFKPF